MAKIVVNSALTVKEAGIFFDYLKAQMSLNHCYFHDIVQHDIEMKLPDTFVIKYTIVFPQPVLCRDLSSPKDKKPTSFRVDFVDSKIGEGQYGQVYSISSTFDFDGHSFKPVLFSYPLAVKIQQHCQCLSEQCSSECKQHNPILLLNNEYDRSIRTAHLKWQPPVFYSKTKASFSVMQRFPAETLSKCLKNDCQGIAILSFDQRMHLTRQLILAVKHQVTDLGMIHRDLKPGNIMVSLAENQVNLIDYQYAQFLEPGQSGILTTSYAGTHNYLPKEFFDSLLTTKTPYLLTPKADVYALGRILMQVWSRPFSEKKYGFTFKDVHQLYAFISEELLVLNELFINITDPRLDDSLKFSIKKLIQSMLAPDPVSRVSIDVVISQFEAIYYKTVPQLSSLKHQTTFPDSFITSSLQGQAVAASSFLEKGEGKKEGGYLEEMSPIIRAKPVNGSIILIPSDDGSTSRSSEPFTEQGLAIKKRPDLSPDSSPPTSSEIMSQLSQLTLGSPKPSSKLSLSPPSANEYAFSLTCVRSGAISAATSPLMLRSDSVLPSPHK